MVIAKDRPVLVTGATGYIAGWIVKKLVDDGITVHAAVRNPGDGEKVGHLEKIAAEGTGTLRLFQTDLLKDGSYAEAMEGCELVFHTASPVELNPKNPQGSLVDPAVKGTKNVLRSVEKTAGVKRVVLTSSVAAVHGYASEMETKGIAAYTEEHWNTSSSVKDNPYAYSKVCAERAAWDMAESQGEVKRWDLVAVNPSLVVGPTLNKRVESSLKLVKSLGDGSMKRGTMDSFFSFVDVQDVADAHIRAGFTPSAGGRYIISAETLSLVEVGRSLNDYFDGKYPFPSKTSPNWLLILLAPSLGLSRKFMRNSLGYKEVLDNSRSRQDLGIEYGPVIDALRDTFRQMIDMGAINPK